MGNRILKIVTPILIAVTSFWFRHIIDYSYILGIFLILLCVTLSLRKLIISILILLAVFGFVIGNALDRNIFVADRLEQDMLQTQDRFVGEGFGKLYKNRVGLFILNRISLPFYKIEKNLFSAIDPNIYFFAGHPRQNKDAYEFEKFSFALLPFFCIGIYISFKKDFRRELLFILIVLLLNTSFSTKFILGPILFFPLIVNFVSKGIEETYLWLKNISR